MINRSTIVMHMIAIEEILPLFGAKASVNLEGFALEVRARNRYFKFVPEFMHVRDGEVRYSPARGPTMVAFVGWRPYFNKVWAEGATKLPFKEFCAAKGLRTPRFDRASPAGMGEFVVKADRSSFGSGVRGPYRQGAKAAVEDLGEPYYEEFVTGRILKAYYWDDKLLCLEMQEPACVQGDGRSTVRELVQANLGPGSRRIPWENYAEMAAFHGVQFDAVLPAGRKLTVDCRYNSPIRGEGDAFANVLPQCADGPIARQLRELGPAFLETIPMALREHGTLYTVDALADAQDRVWLLEMNCNPAIHPEVYLGMFEGLFGPAHRVDAARDAHGNVLGAPAAPALLNVSGPLPLPAPQADFMPKGFFSGRVPGAPSPVVPGDSLSPEESLALARMEVDSGQLDSALRKLKRMIAGPGEVIEALPLAARVYGKLRMINQARDCYNRYLAARPGEVRETFELGITFFETGDREQARSRWQQVLEREPTYPPALFYSGLLAAQEGRVQEARRHLDLLTKSGGADNPYVTRGLELSRELDRPRHAPS